MKKGFTLIEMLVVVAIIGLLSSIVLVGIGPARSRARDTRRIADIRQIQNGLEAFQSAHGRYPTTNEYYGSGGAASAIPGVPVDPQGGDYTYISASGGYVMGICLENNRTGEISSFSPSNASSYNVSPQNVPSTRESPPSCTCADPNSYCVAIGTQFGR